jgi:hypothetical protein
VSRVIVHCGDSPPHGSQYRSYADSYPDGHDRDPTPEALFTQLRDRQIEYNFQKFNDECDKRQDADGTRLVAEGTVWHTRLLT